MVDAFTQNGTIPALKWYINDVVTRPLHWSRREAERNERRIARRKHRYYGETDSYLYEALETHPIKGKDVVIVGSESPWYECICLHFGANVTTIEYRDVTCDIPGVTVMRPDEFQRNPRKFDVVLSISSIEHDGLGRYGDPINPRGDLAAMDAMADLLKPHGKLYLAVPIGRDAIVWNAHRIYGEKRLPMLLKGWRRLAAFGYSEDQFDAALGRWDLQPVLVLEPEIDEGNASSHDERTNADATANCPTPAVRESSENPAPK